LFGFGIAQGRRAALLGVNGPGGAEHCARCDDSGCTPRKRSAKAAHPRRRFAQNCSTGMQERSRWSIIHHGWLAMLVWQWSRDL
jgi:hypothetical protein